MSNLKIYKTNCYSCNRRVNKFKFNVFNFCRPCWNKNFVRPSGTEYEGMDYTRQLVRIRDRHTCQNCLRVWKPGTRRFDIHHLGGVCGSKSRSYDRWTDLSKLITLCHKCHLNLPEVREKMVNKSSPRLERDKNYHLKNWGKIYKKQREWFNGRKKVMHRAF